MLFAGDRCLVVLVYVAKDIHQNHGIVLLSRCFVEVDHVHIEVHTFLFTSLFDVDVLNGIVKLQFEYYIFGLIGRVVLVDGHPRAPSIKASCSVFLN